MNTRMFHHISDLRSKPRRRKPAHSICESNLSRVTPVFVFRVESVADSLASGAANTFALAGEIHRELHRPGRWRRGIELHKFKRLAGAMQIHGLLHVSVGAAACCAQRVINCDRTSPCLRISRSLLMPFVVLVVRTVDAGRARCFVRYLFCQIVHAVGARLQSIDQMKVSFDVFGGGTLRSMRYARPASSSEIPMN
jgi:hypothetical protein